MTNQALILIDLQNDYFDGGRMPLHHSDAAVQAAAKLLAAFRTHGLPVIHIQHIIPRSPAPFFEAGTHGAEIHPAVAPQNGEPLIVKNHPNSFRDTTLQAELTRIGTTNLVIAGAMSQMCVDSTARAAADLGYTVTVAHDACACPALTFNDTQIPAPLVHAAFMAALSGSFATVTDTSHVIAALP